MNKFLLIWNVALTVLVILLILGGCSTSNPQITYLTDQVNADKAAIAQLQATVGQHTQLIQADQAQIASLQGSVQAGLTQLSQSLQQYIQQYVQQYAVAK